MTESYSYNTGSGNEVHALPSKFTLADKWAARLLMVSFFLSMKWQVIATGLVCLYFVCRAVASKQQAGWKNIGWAMFLGSGLLLYLFAIPFTSHEYMHPLLLMLQQRISLLLVPLIFVIAGAAFRELILGELIFFVYGCIVNCLVTNLYVLYQVYAPGKGAIAITHVEYRGLFNAFNGIHPTYMGMELCFSICILLLHDHAMLAKPVVRYFLLLLLLVFLFALGPKSPMIALGIILFHYAFRDRDTLVKNWKLPALSIAVIAACAYFIPFARQRIIETVQGVESRGGNVTDNSVVMRKAILRMDEYALQQHWLAGVGPGRVNHVLQEHYFFYSLINQTPVPYHDPHNEYVYQWLCFGLGGIVLFIAILATQLFSAIHRKNYLYFYLLLIFCVTFFTETVLSMQRGVMMYAVLTSLFFFNGIFKINKRAHR